MATKAQTKLTKLKQLLAHYRETYYKYIRAYESEIIDKGNKKAVLAHRKKRWQYTEKMMEIEKDIDELISKQ